MDKAMLQRQVITRRVALAGMSGFSLIWILGCNRMSRQVCTDESTKMAEQIDLPMPLLRRLHEIGDLIDSKFPADFDCGFGQLGLLLSHNLKHNGGYWCTPLNSLVFGSTGGDGVHFSLVQINGAVTEDSPVVMSAPAKSGDPCNANAIVGSSLMNFLRFGLMRGYFAMEHLVYQRDLTLKAYSSGDWQPTERDHFSVGFGVSERKKQIMQLIASELGVSPLSYTIQEFESLQEHYMPMLKFKAL